jgi:Nucleotidyltransferase domain
MKKPEDKLQELVKRLQTACAENLVSVVLYGSAAREDFHEQYSDVNLLVVLKELEPNALRALAPVMAWWSHEQKLRPPMIMTLQELQESADVFAIELLDIKTTHRTLAGDDVATTIDVPMNLHRVEVEHELRTTLLRLRQHLLLASENPDELRMVLAKSITSVVTLFRHALITLGEDTPHAKAKLLEQAGEVFGFDAQPLRSILELRDDPHQPRSIPDLYHAYLAAIGRVAHELDVRVPKKKWQPTS